MTWSVDARVPVRFGSPEEAGPEDVVVMEGDLGSLGHVAGCACCVPRGGAGRALARLFEQRARGEVAFFRRVLIVASAQGREAVTQALREDPVASGRFRLSLS